MDRGELLDAVEAFLGGEPEPLLRISWPSGREFTILSSLDTPASNLIAHALLEGPIAEWPGIKPGVRLLPLCVAHSIATEAQHWLAYVYNWCLEKAVAPFPKEIFPGLGPSKSLPHARMDHPFPWEDETPAVLSVGGLRVIPVLAYPVTDREARLQHERDSTALDEDLEGRQAPVFSWDRALD